MVKLNDPQETILKGLTLVFVELPKFQPTCIDDKKLKILWLRFMREISENTRIVPPEFLEVPEIKEAVNLTEESSYTAGELEYYESYWKQVSSEKSLLLAAETRGARQSQINIAVTMKNKGMPSDVIADCTGLTLELIS